MQKQRRRAALLKHESKIQSKWRGKGKNKDKWHDKQMMQKLLRVVIAISFLLGIIVLLPAVIVVLASEKDTGLMKSSKQVAELSEEKPEKQVETKELKKEAKEKPQIKVERAATKQIEEVPLEDYIISVVASEMPATFSKEALKAQAVAARTYVLNQMIRTKEDAFVISDTTSDQVYKNVDELKLTWGDNFSSYMEKITAAVDETAGEVITYEGETITPTFFAMSNGFTEAAENYWGNELPYLKSVASKWETGHPDFMEQKVLTLTEVSERLNIHLPINQEVAMEITRTESNRVEALKLNKETFTGREIREKLGLRSNDFSIEQKGIHLIFTTKGYGHGVGMSQHGANGMAQEGKNYQDILQYYYQDIDIVDWESVMPD